VSRVGVRSATGPPEASADRLPGQYTLVATPTLDGLLGPPALASFIIRGNYNELIGGYAEVDVADLDAALAMAKGWPGGGAIEIRPVVQRGG